jgi:hypothetical protein
LLTDRGFKYENMTLVLVGDKKEPEKQIEGERKLLPGKQAFKRPVQPARDCTGVPLILP